jgi:hypothetical protein
LPLNGSRPRVILVGYLGWLSTAAHTQTAWVWACVGEGKLGLEWAWGMLCHVVSLLWTIGQSRGRLQRRSATCIGFYSFNYTTA